MSGNHLGQSGLDEIDKNFNMASAIAEKVFNLHHPDTEPLV
jgi:hypothetical protein